MSATKTTGEAERTKPSTSTVNVKATGVNGLPLFNPKGELNSLSVHWKWLKHTFNLCVASKVRK